MKIVSFYVFAILLHVVSPLHSQNIFREGYIVNQVGDTLSGYIKLQGNKNTPIGIVYKKDDKADVVPLKNTDLRSIVLNDYRYLRLITIGNEQVLAQLLVYGAANLYSWDDKFFLEKENQFYPLIMEEIEVKADFIHRKKTYIGVLKSVLSDCSEVQQSIDQSKLTETSLTEIIEQYNYCVNTKPIVFKKNIPMFRIRLIPLVGLSYTNLNASVSSQYKLNFGFFEKADLSQISMTPGLGIQLSTPRIDDQLSFYTEIRYIKNSFSDEVFYAGATYDQIELSLSYSYLYLPIMFQYDFPVSINYSIFLKLGLIKTFNLTNSSTVIKTQSAYPNVPPVYEDDRFDFYSSQTGFVGGIGVQRKYSKKNFLFMEGRYENPGTIINSTTVGLGVNVYSLIVGITF